MIPQWDVGKYPKHTREDYMTKKCTHSEYYGQWVNERVKQKVLNTIGEDCIRNSTCPHFNDIQLKRWDELAGGIVYLPYELQHMPVGERSLASKVCVLKEAARQIKG